MKRLMAGLLALMLLSGCGAPTGEEMGSAVYTDWSKLTPYEPPQPIYTLHAGYSGAGALVARDDYGPLLPYIGKYSTMERYVIDALPFFGLVTSKGELVSEAVYTQVLFYDDFLVLYCGDPVTAWDEDAYKEKAYSCTLAAADGRWVHELTDGYCVAGGNGLLLTATADGSLDLWNTAGETMMHFDGALFTSRLGEGFSWDEEGGPFIDWTDDKVGYVVSYYVNGEYQDQGVRLYLDFSSGAVTDTPPEGYSAELDLSAAIDATPEPPKIEGCHYLDPITDQVTGETYFHGYYSDDKPEDGSYALFDGQGRMLVKNCDLTRFETSVMVRAGLCSTVEDGYFCYRSLADNALVFRYLMRTNSD